MKILKTLYFHIDGTPTKENADFLTAKGNNYIKATVYYSEGGYSYFTYKQTPRAYFFSCQPVTRAKAGEAGTMETWTMFDNMAYKEMIGEPVTRQSKTKEAAAINYFLENIENFLKDNYSETLTREA